MATLIGPGIDKRKHEGLIVGVLRSALLSASRSDWLRKRAPRYRMVRRTAERFMPGEKVEDALEAAQRLADKRIGSLLTYLGENVTDRNEAIVVANHYLRTLDRIEELELRIEISVKLTHLGLDIEPELCYLNLAKLIERTRTTAAVWIDMESSDYTDATLDIYRRARRTYSNVGVCLQSYLYRTPDDLESLMSLGASIRLVKGAYNEPPDRAYPLKKDVDESFFALARRLLNEDARRASVRTAFATHDPKLIHRINSFAAASGVPKDTYEFQMLYGIQRAEQDRLAGNGYNVMVLIAYGEYWFPWFMRRLAERPANVVFLLRNIR